MASYTRENIHADRESRSRLINTEYELSDSAFQYISYKLRTSTIYLFSSQLNAKCSRYISWKPDPTSPYVDAFRIFWKKEYFYAFLPRLVSKCLQKIITEQACGIVVVPSYPTQPWYSIFKKLLIIKPMIFTPNKELLSSPFRKCHPFWRRLFLEVGILSGKLISDGESQK